MEQKIRDDARCLARIRKNCAVEFKAIARRRRLTRERRVTHPKWRRQAVQKAMESWWLYGDSPEAALINVRLDVASPVGDLPF